MSFDFKEISRDEMLKRAEEAAGLYRANRPSVDPKLDVRVIDCVPEKGLTVVEYTIPADFRNTNGLAHGGGICWIADSAMSLGCCASGDGGPNPTIDMTVNFLRPCEIGDVLTCEVYTSQIGRSMSRAALKIYVGDELRAEAVGNYVRRKPRPDTDKEEEEWTRKC